MRRRGSSPKLQVLNIALMTAGSGLTLAHARADCEFWGRLVESARRWREWPLFDEAFRPERKLLVGGDGIEFAEFLSKPVEHRVWP